MKKIAIALVLLISVAATPQGPATGTPPFGSFGGGPLDIVNLANLNVNIDIPVTQKAGRGANFYYLMSYNSSIWYPVSVNGITTWQAISGYGWQAQTNASVFGRIFHPITHGRCSPGSSFPTWWAATNFVYYDLKGAAHPLVGADAGFDCDGTSYQDPGSTTDGTGLTYNLDTDGSLNGKLTTRDGRVLNLGDSAVPSSIDTNGNQITTDGTNYYDTLGSTALTLSGTPPNPVTYTFPNSSGGNSVVTANYTTFTIQTNFACSGVAEYSASGNLITSITLPDSSQYVFTYEQTPGYGAGYTTGRIASVTLPTGGKIVYTYTGGSNGITCSDGSTAGLTRALQSSPLTTDGTWTYNRSGSTTTITDPSENQANLQFKGIYETQRDMYAGSVNPANLVQTTYTCYNGAAYPCTSTAVRGIQEITATTNVNGFYRQTDTTYNSAGLPLIIKEYDFGSGAVGALLRETDITYASINNGTIQNRPTDVVIKNGLNKFAETQFAYDISALAQTSGVPQHDYTHYSSGFTARGNATSISQWVTGTTFNTTTNTYDDLGNLRTTTDPGGHQTTFDYTDSYSDGANHNTQAFPTTITLPTTWFGTNSHILKNEYYWPSTMLYQAIDQNNQSTTYTYDNMWRPLTINYADGGQTSFVYGNVNGDIHVSYVATKVDSAQTSYSNLLVDGLGRTSRRAFWNNNGSSTPYDVQDYCYDANGRLQFHSYAYQNGGNYGFYGSSPKCSGAGDSFGYDALGRMTQVTHSDGSSVSTTYNGRAFEVQDEGNGSGTRVTHVYQQDGLGRTVSVCELAGGIFGLSPMPTCGSFDLAGTSNGVTTSYSWDPLGNVTQISQGALVRNMTYDGLSHLLSETIPEANGTTTSYGYNADGLLTSRTRLSANQPASCLSAGNCTTSTTSYAYDELHRLWTQSYSDVASENTLNIGMYYDDPNALGVSGYNKGLLTSAGIFSKDYSASYFWTGQSHDQMGRVVIEAQSFCPNGTCTNYWMNHNYNFVGLPIHSTNGTGTSNGAGVQFTYAYNAAARLTQITSNLSDANHPGTLFTAGAYNAGGELLSDTLGNGVNETFSYDPRWRLLSASAVKGTSTVYSLGGPGSGNSMSYTTNSSLATANDSVNGNWSYSYDPLNRIATANESGGTNFSFDIDRNGNRWHQDPTGQGAQLAFDTSTNHITSSGVVYDVDGNIVNDGIGHTYTYDAEWRITQVAGGATAIYSYDALGRRVQRNIGGVLYRDVHDGGNMTAEMRASDGTWMRGEIYAGSHMATYANGTTYFSHSDWLGTERVRSDVNGNIAGTCTSDPYGDYYLCSGTDPSPIKYGGMEYDSESGLYHTHFRYYNSRLGIWMTPDPAGLAVSRLNDPQTLNRYAYVMNGPINANDPTGLASGYDLCLLDDMGNVTSTCASFLGSPESGFGGDPLAEGEALYNLQVALNFAMNSMGVDAIGIVTHAGSDPTLATALEQLGATQIPLEDALLAGGSLSNDGSPVMYGFPPKSESSGPSVNGAIADFYRLQQALNQFISFKNCATGSRASPMNWNLIAKVGAGGFLIGAARSKTWLGGLAGAAYAEGLLAFNTVWDYEAGCISNP